MTLPNYIRCKGVRWIFLDLDDTLFDFRANSAVALRMLYDKYEYILKNFNTYENFQSYYRRHNDRMWYAYHHALIDSETLKRERFERVLRDCERLDNAGCPVIIEDDDTYEYGHEEPVPGEMSRLAMELNDYYLDTLAQQKIVTEGAFELLEFLRRRVMIGVLSNGFQEVQYRKLYITGLWRYVQRMVVSDEIGVTKPDSRLFRYAEQETGIAPGEAVMVGDNPDADISGALAAGWQAVYFDRFGKGGAPEGTPVATSLRDVIGMLDFSK